MTLRIHVNEARPAFVVCTKCGEAKPPGEYALRKHRGTRRRHCHECLSKRNLPPKKPKKMPLEKGPTVTLFDARAAIETFLDAWFRPAYTQEAMHRQDMALHDLRRVSGRIEEVLKGGMGG